MWITTYLIYYLISCLIFVIYTLLYIEEKQKQSEWKEEREPGRRMPPPSSPVPRLSSDPSDVFTVHTIASRSPLRPLVSSLRERDGRPPLPLLVDVIATTSPATSDHRAAPRRSAIMPASSSSPSLSLLQVVREGQRVIQGGPPLPAHPADPLHPAGVRPNICGHLRR